MRLAGIRNWCLPRKVINNMILLLTRFTPGLILSKIIISVALCLRIGLRMENTTRAIIAEKVASVINTSAMINNVMFPELIYAANCKTQSKAVLLFLMSLEVLYLPLMFLCRFQRIKCSQVSSLICFWIFTS